MNDPHLLLLFWAAVARAPHLHVDHLRTAVSHAALPLSAAPEALWRQPAATLQALGLPPAASALLADPPLALLEADLLWLQRAGLRLLSCLDSDYPAQLAAIPAAPAALYVRGAVAALSQPQVALVGSRHPSGAGRETAREFAYELCRLGLTITSGLAQGIDTACHQGALDAGGLTIAVCGTGLDRCYPSHNAALAERISSQGACVSEFPPGSDPLPANFPRRNRLISGLARGTVVIEAARESGSLITARRALEQNREVFAVPGSIRNPTVRGCLDLIREGAHLVTCAADIASQLGYSIEIFSESKQGFTKPLFTTHADGWLDKDCEMLLDALGFEPATVDDLIARTGWGAGPIGAKLLVLELAQQIESQPGGLYCRVR
jgi:DNA processing protein